MKLVYIGAHQSVVGSEHFEGVAEREGTPVEVRKDIALGLIERGDFIEYKPEPPRPPVQKTKEN